MLLKKLVSLLLIGFISFGSTIVFAQPSPEPKNTRIKSGVVFPPLPERLVGEKDIGAAISPMKWGQKAPFTGVLLSPLAIATVIAELNSIDNLVLLELERERKLLSARCDLRVERTKATLEADKQILQAQIDGRKREINILTNRLEKTENSAPNMTLWVGGSFMAGVIVTVLSTVAVSYAVGTR